MLSTDFGGQYFLQLKIQPLFTNGHDLVIIEPVVNLVISLVQDDTG